MADKVRVKFLRDCIVQDQHAGTDKETKFVEGKVYSLPQASADRWIIRGAAEPSPIKRQKRNAAGGGENENTGSDTEENSGADETGEKEE